MGFFNPGTGTSTDPRARAQRLEMWRGIAGVFTVFALIQVVVLIVLGQAPAKEALILLVFAAWCGWLWHRRNHVFDPKE